MEDLHERLACLQRRLEAAKKKRGRLFDLYASKEIEEVEELEVRFLDARNEIENLKMLISAVEADLAREVETRQVAATTEAWLMTLRDRLEEIEEDTEEAWQQRREIVSLLVERITVGRDADGRVTVSVTYRFAPPESGAFMDGERDSTEFNPDHADEEGELAAVFVREVADVLAENAP